MTSSNSNFAGSFSQKERFIMKVSEVMHTSGWDEIDGTQKQKEIAFAETLTEYGLGFSESLVVIEIAKRAFAEVCRQTRMTVSEAWRYAFDHA